MFKLAENVQRKTWTLGEYLSKGAPAPTPTPTATKTPEKVTTPVATTTSEEFKYFGNTKDLNKGKNPYYDNIDIYETMIGDQVFRGQKPFLTKIKKANSEYFKATGKHFQLSSGDLSTFRTHAQQNDPWVRSNGGRLFAAANPNGRYANHMGGKAIDMGGKGGIYTAYEPYLRPLNIKNDIPNDGHHFYDAEVY